jgi:outer membrane biogenesis lipoprotein LolB
MKPSKGECMKLQKILILVTVVLIMIGCGMSERRANRATAKSADYQTKVSKERLKLIDDYKKCVEKAGEDKEKIEGCDSYLKAAEALK